MLLICVALIAQKIPTGALTREAFINAIRTNTVIGGSTNCPPHLIAVARHMGVELTLQDWETYGYDLPLLVNVQPAGKHLAEDFHRAGGIPVVMRQLLELLTRCCLGNSVRSAFALDHDVHFRKERYEVGDIGG